MGLGVLPVVGVLSAGKLAVIAGGLYAAWKLRGAPEATVTDTTVSAALPPGRGGALRRSVMPGMLRRPGASSPGAARDAFTNLLGKPIGSEQQLQRAAVQADNYLASAVKAGILDAGTATKISSQPLAARITAVAAQVGVSPTILSAPTSSTLQTVASSFTAPLATFTTTTAPILLK